MMSRIDADLLIPGRGEPIINGSVVLDRDSISFVGQTAELPSGSADADVVVQTLMPGLWDCHAHFGVSTASELDGFEILPPSLYGARAVGDLERTINGGVTSVRELGGYGLDLVGELDAGRITGPTLYGAGWMMSPTAGHADPHSIPLPIAAAYMGHQQPGKVADGVPGVLKAVRTHLRRGAKVIKICTSGGVMSEVDHWSHQQFADREIRAIVEEAARAERVVAAHAEGKAGIMAAIRAGVHTIEHGDALDEEAIEGMLESGMMLVPTLWVTRVLLEMPDDMPDHAYRKLSELAALQSAGLELAINAGVPIATGTDIFLHGDSYGTNSREMRHLVDAGMSPLAAIEAGTANGPDTLGPQAPSSGQIKEAFDADLIALDFDPLANPNLWGTPDRVTHVWKAGVMVKQPVVVSQESPLD